MNDDYQRLDTPDDDDHYQGRELSKYNDKFCGCGPATQIVQLYDNDKLFRVHTRHRRCRCCMLWSGLGCCLFLCGWTRPYHSVVVKDNISSYHDEPRNCLTSFITNIFGLFPCCSIPGYITMYSSSADVVEVVMEQKNKPEVMKMIDTFLQK